MHHSRTTVLGLCLSLGLTQVALPAVVLGADAPATRARIVKTAAAVSAANAPIGHLETSNAVFINGRPVSGRQEIWNGELIQAAGETPVQMAISSIGQMTLAGGAVARVSKADNAGSPTLIASVQAGNAQIALHSSANAYLEAAGQSWIVSGGTLLNLSVNNGEAKLETVRGKAVRLGNWALNLSAVPALDETNERAALLRSIKEATRGTELDEKPALRLLAGARAAMIGMVESTGVLKLNGRATRRQELLWDGELIQAPADAEARALLAGVGNVRLAKGASARLSLAETLGREKVNAKRVLSAQLVQGELTMRLDANVGAYVETQGKAFAAEPGAQFRLSEQPGNVTLEIKAGRVREIQPWATELSANLGDGTNANTTAEFNIRPLDNKGHLRNVAPSSSQELRFLVTDRAGKIAPGIPVVFKLDESEGQRLGTLGTGDNAGATYETRSDDKGIVVVPFTAGRSKGSASISAAVAGANAASGVVVVSDDEKFWKKRNAWPVLGVIAGVVVAGVVVALTHEEKLPIQGSGSTQIVP